MRKYIGWFSVGSFCVAAIGLFWDATTKSESAQPATAMPGQTAPAFGLQNREAPNFALQDIHGNTVRLSDFEGKIKIVDFWATWCPPCRAEIPHFKALQAKYGNEDLVVIGISLDREGVAAVKPYANENSITYPLLIGDLQTVKAYGNVQSIPTTFVIDQQGRFYSKHVGYKPGTVFERDIEALRKRQDS